MNAVWSKLSREILSAESTDRPTLEAFCDMLTRLRPRCDADSRPLCALLAGVIHHLRSQLGDCVDTYTVRSAAREARLAEGKQVCYRFT